MLFNREIKLSFVGNDIPPIEKLRVQFEAEKLDGLNFNHARIRVYNMKESTRAALAKIHYSKDETPNDMIKCYLHVGYGDDLVRLFAGDIRTAIHTKIGPDWITDLNVYASLATVKNSVVNISYAKTTGAKKILDDILSYVQGMDVKYTQEALEIIRNATVKSYHVSSNAFLAASEFTKRFDLKITVEEDGVVLVYKENRSRESQGSRNSDNYFNVDNGLIGSPQVTPIGVTFRALLRPTIRLLQTVYVSSKSINESLANNENFFNTYFVKNIKHIGDTHSDEWYTEIEANYKNLKEVFLDDSRSAP